MSLKKKDACHQRRKMRLSVREMCVFEFCMLSELGMMSCHVTNHNSICIYMLFNPLNIQKMNA